MAQNANESRNIFQLCVMALFTFCMLALLCNERKNVVCSSENMKRWMRDGSRQWWPHPREEVLMSCEGSSRRKSSAHKCRNDPSIWEDCGNIRKGKKKEEKRCRRRDKFTLIIIRIQYTASSSSSETTRTGNDIIINMDDNTEHTRAGLVLSSFFP